MRLSERHLWRGLLGCKARENRGPHLGAAIYPRPIADQGLGTQHGGKVGVKWSPHCSPKLALPFPAETLAMVPESWPAWPEAWTRTSGPLVAPPAHPTPR